MNASTMIQANRSESLSTPRAAHRLPEAGRARGLNLVRSGVIYLLLGVALGVFMGASGDHSLRSVHAHIGLFGWVSMALMGVIYLNLPDLAQTRLAAAHVVLHHAGLAGMMIGLAGKGLDIPGADPLLGLGSSLAAVAIAVFAYNLLRCGRVR